MILNIKEICSFQRGFSHLLCMHFGGMERLSGKMYTCYRCSQSSLALLLKTSSLQNLECGIWKKMDVETFLPNGEYEKYALVFVIGIVSIDAHWDSIACEELYNFRAQCPCIWMWLEAIPRVFTTLLTCTTCSWLCGEQAKLLVVASGNVWTFPHLSNEITWLWPTRHNTTWEKTW